MCWWFSQQEHLSDTHWELKIPGRRFALMVNAAFLRDLSLISRLQTPCPPPSPQTLGWVGWRSHRNHKTHFGRLDTFAGLIALLRNAVYAFLLSPVAGWALPDTQLLGSPNSPRQGAHFISHKRIAPWNAAFLTVPPPFPVTHHKNTWNFSLSLCFNCLKSALSFSHTTDT